MNSRSSPRTPRAVLVLGVLVVLLGLLVVDGSGPGEVLRSTLPGIPGGGPAEVVLSPAAGRDLTSLRIAPKSRDPPYRREAFGTPWADENRNGCDTRNDVLARDLEGAAKKPGDSCRIATGRLRDPYTGRTLDFRAGKRSRAVQIDHVVALADAWASGASAWTAAERRRFANDPENLLAVDGRANEDKGPQDAAGWLPPHRAFRCAYVARQLRVKARYGLSATREERAAVLRVLGTCPGFSL